MNRISSLFNFVGNWLKNVPKIFKVGEDTKPNIISQYDIDINTGATSYNSRRASNDDYIPIKTEIKIIIESGHEYSIRCYDSNHTYLTPSPTPSYVSESRIFDTSKMPAGTKYLRFVWKNADDSEMGMSDFKALRFNNNYAVADSSDYSISMLAGDGLEYSVDFSKEESNIKLSTYACAVANKIVPDTKITDALFCGVTGYATGSGAWLFLFIPLNLDNRVNNVTVDKLLFNLRAHDEYVGLGANKTATDHKSYITETAFYKNQNILRIILHATSGTFCTNNSSFAGEVTASLTFTA